MKAFWWFEENSIAGMARPGFNAVPWFDFSYVEAVMVGWIGRFSSGSTPLNAFYDHLRDYGHRIRKSHQIDDISADEALRVLNSKAGLRDVLGRIKARSQILESYEVSDDALHFQFNNQRLQWECDYLRREDIAIVVSLTEHHHDRDVLAEHFDTYHLGIEDMDAPRLEQVQQLAGIVQTARSRRQRITVHCLAGIGRTSTMLMGAHLLLGVPLGEIKARIERQNPAFVLTGKQSAFIDSIENGAGVRRG